MEQVLIRAAAEADMKRIGEIKSANGHEVYDDKYVDYRFIESLTPERCRAHLSAYAKNPGQHVLVAEREDGAILGYSGGRPSPDVLGAYWLEFLDVAEDEREQGIGAALIRSMAVLAREQGYSQMIVDVINGNTSAEDFYEHLGAELFNENYMQDLDGFLVKSKLYAWTELDALASEE